MSTKKSYSNYDLTRVNFNYRSPKPGKSGHASVIHRGSYVHLHETLLSADLMYNAIEKAWKDQGYFERTGGTFYKDYATGIKQIKSRSTRMINQGYPLSEIRGAEYRASSADLTEPELMELIRDLQGKNQQRNSFQTRSPGISAYTPNGF
jgi:hypothetical protein